MTYNATVFFDNFRICIRAGQVGCHDLRASKAFSMTTTPPSSSSSSDGPVIPPRHRPTLSEFAKSSRETDLWDLDEDLPAGERKAAVGIEPRRAAVPTPRDAYQYAASSDPAEPADSLVTIGTQKNKVVRPSKDRLIARAKDDLDDLDDWVEPAVAPAPAPTPAAPAPAPAESPAAPVVEATAEEEAPPAVQAAPVPAAPPVQAAPISLLPKLNLSPVERIGFVTLLVLLLIGGGVLAFRTFGRLPTEAKQIDASSFPIKGKLFTIAAADTYWRAPVSDGAMSEIVRRGTALVPVVSFKVSGGPAAVRLIFRDSDGKVTGDVVTRPVKEGSELEVPGTAGFDEIGMHAAYRTGQTKPWTVEFHEAASANSPSKDFKKIFEMRISIARR